MAPLSVSSSALSAPFPANAISYLESMPINITLWPGSFTDSEITPLEAVLDGFSRIPGKAAQKLLASVEVNVLQEDLKQIDDRPFFLMDGFVDFAKRLHARFPDFVFFASLNNQFYLDYLTALSGDISTVQRGCDGTITIADPIRFLRVAFAEIEHFGKFSTDRSTASELVWQTHSEDLSEYLLPQVV